MKRWTETLQAAHAALLLFVTTNALASGPPGDECDTAFAITTGVVFGDTSDNGGVNDDSSCASGDVIDEWYVFTAPFAGTITATTCGSGTDFDTTLTLYTLKLGCFDTIELDCNDDFCGLQSRVSAEALVGEDIYIRVSGWSGATGAYELAVSFEPTTCAQCTPVGEGVYVGSTLGSPSGPDDTSCTFNDTIDEWFCYTPTCSGIATVSTCGGLTNFDTSLAVFSACGGTELDCNDDTCGLQSTITFSALAGETYYVRLAGFNGAAGTYEMTIECAAAGDECEDCISIDEGTFAGSTVDNTGDFDDSSCGVSDVVDEWYCFTPSCGGTAVAAVTEANFNVILSVFDSCGGTEIVCDFGEVMWQAVAGTTYYIRISGQFDATGDYLLETSCPSNTDWFFDDPVDFGVGITGGGYEEVLDETFEEGTPLPGGNIIDDPLDETTDNEVFDPGDIEPGVTFQSHVLGGGLDPPAPAGMNGMFVVPAGVFGAPNVTAASAAGTDHAFDILLDPPLAAIGLQLYSTKSDGIVEVRLFSPGMTLIAETAVELIDSNGFLGVILDDGALAGEPGVGVARIYTSDFPESIGGFEGISEMQGYALVACPGDANGDGVVDVLDIVVVITGWGSCGGSCEGDVNGDDVVNVQDLVSVITNWGACGK